MKKTSPAKEYLRKLRAEQKELRALEKERASIRAALYPSAIRYDRDKVQTSPVDTLSEKMMDICRLDDEIGAHIEELDKRKAQAMYLTKQIDDPACRMVIELYYLTLKENGELRKWEEVAGAMGYSERHVLNKIHPRALREFEQIMKKGSK